MPLIGCLYRWSVVSGLCVGWALGQGKLPEHGGAIKPPATPNPEKMDVLKQLSSSFEEVSQRSGRAVVQIFVRSYVPTEGSATRGDVLTAEDSSGSGIIMSEDGYILTNAHVVKGAHSVKVQLNVRAEGETPGQARRRALAGTLIGMDHDSDLAVIKVDRNNLPYLMFGDSDELRQGQIVLALGNPLGLDNSVSMGVVSAVSRQIKSDDPMVYIQTDTPINPGNSGGPLVDTDGRVVGINTFILTQSGGSEGIGFAIPSKIARDVYQQLKTQGHVHRAQLGIVAQTVTPDMAEGLKLETDHGVIISDVEPDGAAAHAGLQVDDIVTGMNGRIVSTLHQLEARVFRTTPGTKLTMQVQRGTEQLELPVVTEEQSGGELDALADMVDPVKNLVPKLGIVGLDITKPVRELMPDLRRPAGVVVAARRSGAPYSGPPLDTGDAIYAINRQVVNGVAQLRQYLAAMKAGDSVVLLIEREGHLLYVAMQLD
ncbi:MAG: trypsin-like peptidase domain-containing protein [Acidobacteriota bacterium]|nr:trypsin-like peptidase domain-containing protein [Acidobacteriota bacterium]